MGWLKKLGKSINRAAIDVSHSVSNSITVPIKATGMILQGKDPSKLIIGDAKKQVGTALYMGLGGPVIQPTSSEITGNKYVKRATGSILTDAESGLNTMQKYGRGEQISQAEWNSIGRNTGRAAAAAAVFFTGGAAAGAFGGGAAAGVGAGTAAGAGAAGAAGGSTIALTGSTITVGAGAAAAAPVVGAAAAGGGWLTTATSVMGLLGAGVKLLGGGAAPAQQVESAPAGVDSFIPGGYVAPGSTAGDFLGDGNYTTTAPALTAEQFAASSNSMLIAGAAAAIGLAYIATRKKK